MVSSSDIVESGVKNHITN